LRKEDLHSAKVGSTTLAGASRTIWRVCQGQGDTSHWREARVGVAGDGAQGQADLVGWEHPVEAAWHKCVCVSVCRCGSVHRRRVSSFLYHGPGRMELRKRAQKRTLYLGRPGKPCVSPEKGKA
jgi:hypothetical protein